MTNINTPVTKDEVFNVVKESNNPNGISAREITDVINSKTYARHYHADDQVSKAFVMSLLSELVSDGVLTFTFSKIKGKKLFSVIDTTQNEEEESAPKWKAIDLQAVKDAAIELLKDGRKFVSAENVKLTLRDLGYWAVYSSVRDYMYRLVENGVLISSAEQCIQYMLFGLSDATKADILAAESEEIQNEITIVSNPCDVVRELETSLINLTIARNNFYAGDSMINSANVTVQCDNGKNIVFSLGTIAQILSTVSNSLRERAYLIPYNAETVEPQVIIINVDAQ